MSQDEFSLFCAYVNEKRVDNGFPILSAEELHEVADIIESFSEQWSKK